jgi:hypothetical protein
MQAGMHEIAVNVIVHYKVSASVVFLCLFIMVLILKLYACVVFILHLLRKARGCCMHVLSSIITYLHLIYVLFIIEGANVIVDSACIRFSL